MIGLLLRWWVRLPLAVALGAVALVGLQERSVELQTWERPGDRVAAAIEALRTDPVHVTDDGRPMLSVADEAALSARITESGLPAYVVVWEASYEAGYGTDFDAADQITWALQQQTGGPVAVVLWQGPDRTDLYESPGWDWRPAGTDYLAETEPETFGDASTRLTEWVDRMAGQGPWLERRSTESYAGVLAASVTLGLPALGVVWVAVGLLRMLLGLGFRRRRVGAGGPRGRMRT